MTRQRRQQLLLGGLLAVLLVVAAPYLFRGNQAERPATPSNPAGGGALPARATEVSDVKLELLQADQDGIVEPERNPFRFEAKAPPPSAAPAPRRSAPPPDFTPPPSAPAGPAPPPPIPLRFIGIVASSDGTRAASLTDGRGTSFLAREGDIIEGRYQLLRLGPDSVELAYLDGRGRQTIRQSGQ